jgi:transcription elongation factor Elf1
MRRERTAWMPCPVCRDKQLVEITLHAGSRTLILRSCSSCETKWWESEGREVGLENVLEAAKP